MSEIWWWLKATHMWIHMPMTWDDTWKWHACDHTFILRNGTYVHTNAYNDITELENVPHVNINELGNVPHVNINAQADIWWYYNFLHMNIPTLTMCSKMFHVWIHMLMRTYYLLHMEMPMYELICTHLHVIVLRNSKFKHSCLWWHVIVLKMSCVC